MGSPGTRLRSWPRVGIAVNLLGALASIAILGAAVASLIPIDNPGVQHCGTPASFLIGGHTNTYPDAQDHVAGPHGKVITFDQAQLNNAYHHPCSQRVADRMGPVFVAFAAGVASALLSFVVSLVMWWLRSAPDPSGVSA